MSRIFGRFKRPAGDVEGADVSQQGYPEEAPPGTEPGGQTPPEETPQRQGGEAGREHAREATEHGDHKATGDTRSAG